MSHINPSIRKRSASRDSGNKSLSYYLDGILRDRDYYILSESITLLESDRQDHRDLALDILEACYESRNASFRYGITGTPGVGKSTFIDGIVEDLVEQGESVGILTIDPSSVDGRGSILGDKTRMEKLAKEKNVFIRPSPSKLHLGGIHQYTFEAIVMCEAAGMTHIFVETVGIGQSEIDVSNITDATIVLVLPGSGDSLQGIKKGILEKADLLVIHKADGDRIDLANQSVKELGKGLHFSKGTNRTPIVAYSSLTRYNFEQLSQSIRKLKISKVDTLSDKRRIQEFMWLQTRVNEYIQTQVAAQLKGIDHLQRSKNQTLTESPINRFKRLKDQVSISINIKQE